MWQTYTYFILSGVMGASAHYIKKVYFDCETTESFFKWFGKSNIKATVKVTFHFLQQLLWLYKAES